MRQVLIFLTFIVIIIFGQHHYINIACVVIIGVIFILDAVDGIVARKQNQTSTFGAVFDIAADRVIENVFWIYFATRGLVHVWMPVAVVTRGFLIDGVRSMALTDGKTPFEMMSIPWTRVLTSSRISRLFSGFSKALAFLCLATMALLQNASLNEAFLNIFSATSTTIATIAVAICLIRGFPVLIDGWKYIKQDGRISS